MKVKEFIGREGKLQIEQAIKEAELDTSGEIRVHIESKCTSDPLQRAVYIFNYLKMYNTQARNGVLIYVAVESRKFAIIGDAGILSGRIREKIAHIRYILQIIRNLKTHTL